MLPSYKQAYYAVAPRSLRRSSLTRSTRLRKIVFMQTIMDLERNAQPPLTFLDRLYELSDTDSQGLPCVLFIDFARASDTVPHEILIANLAHFGIGEKLLKLIVSYLTDRTQFVKINDHKSTFQKVTSVPQGSILGPHLSLMFINDLPDTMPQADSFGYADDYKAMFSAQSGLDHAVDALATWLKEDKMF